MPKRLQDDYSEESYTIIPQDLIQGSVGDSDTEDLDIQEMSVWVYIVNQSEEYDLSTSQIAERFDRSPRFIRKVLGRLVDKGLIYRDDRSYQHNAGPQFVVADDPSLLKKWKRRENLTGNGEKETRDETDKSPSERPNGDENEPTQEPETGQDRDPDPRPDRRPQPPTEADLIPGHSRISLRIPARTGPHFQGVVTDGLPVFTDPPFESDRHPIRHTLPYHWRRQVKSVEYLSTTKYLLTSGIGYCGEGGMHVPGKGGMSIPGSPRTPEGRNEHSGEGGMSIPGKGGMSIPGHTTSIKGQVLRTKTIASPLPKERLTNVRRQRARAGDSQSPGVIARKNLQAPALDRSRNRWLGVFGEWDKFFYTDVVAYVLEEENESEKQTTGGADSIEHRPDDNSQIEPEKASSQHLAEADPVKRAYRAIWIEPFEEEDNQRPTTPTGDDRALGEQAGIDPKRVMLLRQVAETIIGPHTFDIENTYESPGRDPWAVRMYAELAFPDTNVKDSQKAFIDEKVGQALPSSPAEWAEVLLHGLRREWSPDFPENFTKAYRHRLGIEIDPNRPPMPGGRRISPTNQLYGNGIDLSEVSLERVLPDRSDEDSETEESDREKIPHT